MTDRNHLIVHIYKYDRHMIVYMTVLYTRLVTYARLYILRFVISFYHDISYISFITLFLILIILLSFISVYHIVTAYIVIIQENLSLYTHSLGRFWRPCICTFRYWIFYALVQVFVEFVRFARSWSFSLLILIFLPLFIPIFVLFLIHVYQIQSLFQFFLYDIMRVCLYVILQWSLIYFSLDL